MAQKTSKPSGNVKNVNAGSISLKKFFSKLISHKSNVNEKKDKHNDDDHLEVDALPDPPRSKNKLSDNSFDDNNVKDVNHGNEENSQETNDGKYDENLPDDNSSEENEDKNFQSSNKQNFPKGSRTRSKKSKGKESPQVVNQTNISVNASNSVGLHIGTAVYNNMTLNKTRDQTTRPNKIVKTEAIKVLLESKDKIQRSHLAILSDHFGSDLKHIAGILGVTTGQLHAIGEKYQSCEERAFQVLKLWWETRGVVATVGELCTTLWQSKIQTAREAVQQLSLNIADL